MHSLPEPNDEKIVHVHELFNLIDRYFDLSALKDKTDQTMSEMSEIDYRFMEILKKIVN